MGSYRQSRLSPDRIQMYRWRWELRAISSFYLFGDHFENKRYCRLLGTILVLQLVSHDLISQNTPMASCHGYTMSLTSRNWWYWTWLLVSLSYSTLWRNTTACSHSYWHHLVRSSYTLNLTPSPRYLDFRFQIVTQKAECDLLLWFSHKTAQLWIPLTSRVSYLHSRLTFYLFLESALSSSPLSTTLSILNYSLCLRSQHCDSVSITSWYCKYSVDLYLDLRHCLS